MRALVRFLRLQWLQGNIGEPELATLLNANRITELEAEFVRFG